MVQTVDVAPVRDDFWLGSAILKCRAVARAGLDTQGKGGRLMCW